MQAQTAFYLAMDAARRIKQIGVHRRFYEKVLSERDQIDLDGMVSANLQMLERYRKAIQDDHREEAYQKTNYLAAIERELTVD